ncbi:hypothetical protein I3843_16G004400 [Carya illinoinensis]|nr:hypothetical protein I3843_16G004400 [Carya illinoinensis]
MEEPSAPPQPPPLSSDFQRTPTTVGFPVSTASIINQTILGVIAEIVDRGSTSCGVSGALYTLILCVTGCSCLYSCFYRSKLRGQYFLEESPCTDCCVHCFCQECALCQEYRELKHHGFEMSIGWHGNVERQKRIAATNPPAVQGGMTR